MSEDIPRIYVACLAAYNNGILHGAWIDADQSVDDINEDIRKVLLQSPIPLAEEWAIHDYENFGPLKLSEWEPIDKVAALGAMHTEHGEAFAAWVSNDSSVLDDLDDVGKRFTEAYVGEFESESDFAMTYPDNFGDNYLVTAIGSGEVPEFALSYIDWEKVGRDLLIDGFWSAQSSTYSIFVFNNV